MMPSTMNPSISCRFSFSFSGSPPDSAIITFIFLVWSTSCIPFITREANGGNHFRNDHPHGIGMSVFKVDCYRVWSISQSFSCFYHLFFRFFTDILVIPQCTRYSGDGYWQMSSDVFYGYILHAEWLFKSKQRYWFQTINPNIGVKYESHLPLCNAFVTFADFGNVPAIVCRQKS